MPSSSVNAFNMQPYDVAKTDSFPTLESTNIRDIKVEKEDGTVEFSSDESGTSWTVKDQDGNEETAGATAASDLTNAVSSLTYKNSSTTKVTIWPSMAWINRRRPLRL